MRKNYYKRICTYLRSDAREKTKITRTLKSGPVEEFDFDLDRNHLTHNPVFRLASGPLQRAIFRRGEPFTMHIKFREDFQVDLSKIQMRFFTGEDPKAGITKHQFRITDTKDFRYKGQKREGSFWAARLLERNGQTLTVSVLSDAVKTPIGVWRVFLIVGDQVISFLENIYIIFNTKIIDGGVYVAPGDSSVFNEYLANESGILYKGRYDPKASDKGVEKCYWNYGQFSCPAALPAAIYSLERIKHTAPSKFKSPALNLANPITVARAMSFIAIEYIVHGLWGTDNFPPNENPDHWRGSAAILKKFMNNFQRVRYGQCWVIAAIACTLCRAIGIPCRPVTIYESAHCSQYSFNYLYVARVKNESGKDAILPSEQKDTTWTFHVWIECRLTRPDLPSNDYSGWQAVETCPRNNIAGPTSIKAVKEGHIGLNYDVHEIFSEINSDALFVKRYKNNKEEIMERYSNLIGPYIVTKDRYGDTLEDITLQYKYKDGSPEERKVYAKAFYEINHAPFEDSVIDTAKLGGVFFTLPLEENPMIGDIVWISMVALNKEKEERFIQGKVQVSLVNYANELIREIDIKGTLAARLKPGEEGSAGAIGLYPKLYLTDVRPNMLLYAGVNAVVEETGKSIFKGRTIAFRKPELRLDIHDETLKVGQPFDLHVSFDNSLDMELKSCFFSINSNIFKDQITHPFRDVAAKEKVEHKISLKPAKAELCSMGLRKYSIAVYFDSNLLKDLSNSISRNCKEK